jgi:hypothetical protein
MRTTAGSPILIDMKGVLYCAICGEPVGVYESILVIGRREHEAPRTTSLAREPNVGFGAEHVAHRSCAPLRWHIEASTARRYAA